MIKMKTRAARIHGKNDIRVQEFELPEIKDDEILTKVISNSICMSTYKAAKLGSEHKRVPEDIAENPVITGHEFAGEIVQVGAKWQDQFKPGDKFAVQPALNYLGSPYSPGYSYKYFGGNATYTILPHECMELGCLLKYEGESFADASLAEPMSCIIGAFHANYHTKDFVYEHFMGIKEGGKLALLASAGPMGMGAIDYMIHCDRKPSLLVVSDIDSARLKRAESILTIEEAKKHGVELHYVNTNEVENGEEYLMELTNGEGYDDVFVYAPVKPVVEMGGNILGRDGCLNFFAGPTDNKFSASFNFYNVHYASTHIAGTSGGSTGDMIESLEMTAKGTINPAVMVTHIGGLEAVPETILNLPNIPGGKKLIYPHIDMELTAIDDFQEKGNTDERFKVLSEIVKDNNGLWCLEAEKYVIANF
jgi:threonine dehydrogenase-like Zn-dependent dehydrogenase